MPPAECAAVRVSWASCPRVKSVSLAGRALIVVFGTCLQSPQVRACGRPSSGGALTTRPSFFPYFCSAGLLSSLIHAFSFASAQLAAPQSSPLVLCHRDIIMSVLLCH